MPSPICKSKKGVILFMVLATVVIVSTLAVVILNGLLNHFRQTTHRVERISAYYAALAGMNLGMDKLRDGSWTTGLYSLCSSSTCTVQDTDIPYRVDINISAPNTTGIRTINLTVNYTYN